MHAPWWTDDHARLIAETAPPAVAPNEAEVDRVWNLVAEVVTAPAPVRRSRWRIAVGVGVAAVVLGTSGIASADLWSARTGRHNTDAESVRLSGPGELIDPRGDDYEQVLVEEIADIPFPSDEARRVAVAFQVDLARQEATDMREAEARGEGYVSVEVTGGMRAEAARAAVCAWANTWAATTAAGDTDGRDEAIAMLESAPSWPAVTDVDADQTFTWRKQWVTDSDTGETRLESYLDNTPFAYLPLAAAAARGHKLEAMGRPFLKWTSCRPQLMPDLPSAIHPEFRVR